MKTFNKWLKLRESISTMTPNEDSSDYQIMSKLDIIINKINYLDKWMKETEESVLAYLEEKLTNKRKAS